MPKKDNNKQEAAFFDIDGTLIKGNTGIIYIRHFFFKGMLGIKDMLLVLKLLAKYAFHGVGYEKAMQDTYKIIEGLDEKEVKNMISKHYKISVKKKYFHDMKKVIKEHKKAGRKIVLVTNSWKPMVEDIAKELKVDALFSTETEITNGKYTGKIIFACHGKKKGEVVKAYANNYNIDLKKSYAYGDHLSDRYMLSAVGNPVAINPEFKLKKYAFKKNWEMIKVK